MATPKQEKLIKLLLENVGTEGETKSLGAMLKEAGYSPAIQKNPKLILESETIQEGISDAVKDLEELRAKALNELKARNLEEEPLRDVVKAVDTYTKNHQLLSGGKTANIGVDNLSDTPDDELDRLIAEGESGEG